MFSTSVGLLLISILNAMIGFSSADPRVAAFARIVAAVSLALAFSAVLSARYFGQERHRGTLD